MKRTVLIEAFLVLSVHILADSCLDHATDLQVYMRSGSGVFVDSSSPTFAFRVSGTSSKMSQKFRIVVNEYLQGGTVWDSGWITSNSSVVRYGTASAEGAPPTPLKSYWAYNWGVYISSNECPAVNSTFFTGILAVSDEAVARGWDDELESQWIGATQQLPKNDCACYEEDPQPLVRRKINHTDELGVESGDDIAWASVVYVGLGFSKLLINGERPIPAGGAVQAPQELGGPWTTYANRTYYYAVDVTARLRELVGNGRDIVIGVELGKGQFDPLPMLFFGKFDFRKALSIVGPPTLRLALVVRLTNGTRTVVATESLSGRWTVGRGAILRNNVYLGEQRDNRIEESLEVQFWMDPGFNPPTPWPRAVHSIAAPRSGVLRLDYMPPLAARHMQDGIKAIHDIGGGSFVVELREEIAGWLMVGPVSLPQSHVLNLTFAELVFGNGSVNTVTTLAGAVGRWDGNWGQCAVVPAIQRDTVTFRGIEYEAYQPQFTYHAFRYVQIDNWPTAAAGPPTLQNFSPVQLLGWTNGDETPFSAAVAAGPEAPSSSSSSSPPSGGSSLLSRIDAMARRSFQANFVQGIQSDCPARERLGYGGDVLASAGAGLSMFDAAAFYRKRAQDYAQSQMPNGGLPETAPWIGISSCSLGGNAGPVEWGAALVWLQDLLWRAAGDMEVQKEYVEQVHRWIGLLERTVDAQTGLLHSSLDYFISDAPGMCSGKGTGAAVEGTAFLYQQALLASRSARRVGNDSLVQEYEAVARNAKAAFRRAFWDGSTGRAGQATEGGRGNVNEQLIAMGFGLAGNGSEPLQPEAPTPAALSFLREQYVAANFSFQPATFATWQLMLQAPLWSSGAGEALYGWVSDDRYPSYGYMLANNASSMWEHWNALQAEISQNHAWLNSVVEFLRGHVAGLRLHPLAVGSDRLIVAPQPFGWRRLSAEESWGFAPGHEPPPVTSASTTRRIQGVQVGVSWAILDDGGEALGEGLGRDVARAAGRTVQLNVSAQSNTRLTVRVPLCRSDAGDAEEVVASCLPGVKGRYEQLPTPAAVFDVQGFHECKLSGPWICEPATI